jgi:TolB-like protein
MQPSPGRYGLVLLGPFRLTGPDGRLIDITSRRSMALVAMLALSRDGERSRGWLQERLWGSRGDTQAQGSLRTELSDLRKRVNLEEPPLLAAGHERVRLDLSRLDVDVRAAQAVAAVAGRFFGGDLLPGLEIPGERGFEAWLFDQRQALAHALERAQAGSPRGDLAGPSDAQSRHGAIVDPLRPWSEVPRDPQPRRLLAVLAFDSLSADPEIGYFSDQMSENIQIAACGVSGLNVIGRASSFQLRGAARAPEAVSASLGATHLLDGSVTKSGDRVWIAASRVDCASGATLWSDRYDRELVEVFDVQDEIAGAVANALRATFSPRGDASAIDP